MTAKTKAKKELTLNTTIKYILIFCGLVGLLASFTLTYDKIHVLKDPNYIPSCNINPILSCGSVMKTKQADFLGIPNTIFGLVGFTVVITIGVMMAAGAKFAKWFWRWFQVGLTLGLFGVWYLFFEGIFRINAICPYCFLVWLIVPPLFFYTLLYNIRSGFINVPKKLAAFMNANHGNILIVYYMVLLGMILNHFWYYWSTLI